MFFSFARLTDIKSGLVQSVIYAPKSRTVIPLDHVILDAGIIQEVPQEKCLFLRGSIQAEDNGGNVGDVFELTQDISKTGWLAESVYSLARSGRIRIVFCHLECRVSCFLNVPGPGEEYETR